MINSIPTFDCIRHGNLLGKVSAVSYKQAMKRAERLYGRCEVITVDGVAKADNRRAGTHNEGRVNGRAPYAVGNFDARRAAEIAAWKAANA